MESNGHLYANVLGRRMDKFHNFWESSLDIKLSNFNSGLTCVLIVIDWSEVMCQLNLMSKIQILY